jgi:hypothetical protein
MVSAALYCAAASATSLTEMISSFGLRDGKAEAALRLFIRSRGINLNTIVGGRLTTQSGVPITTSDRVSQGTLYFTPYQGNKIALYDGSIWQLYNYSELSLSLASVVAGYNYDVWIYPNSGTPTLELSIWANDGNRVDGVWFQDGVYVKVADPSRRYIGVIRGTGAGVIEDSSTKRFVNNFYNRTERAFLKVDTNAHSYDGPARLFNGDSSNIFEWVTSDLINVSACIECEVTSATASAGACGLGFDSYTIAYSYTDNQKATTAKLPGVVFEQGLDGYHFISILEDTQTSGSKTYTSVKARGIIEQ